MLFSFKKRRVEDVEYDEATQKVAADIAEVIQKAEMFVERLEQCPEMFDVYEDMVLNCIENLDEKISMLKVEFMAKKDAREYKFPDEALDASILILSSHKKLLAEKIESLSIKNSSDEPEEIADDWGDVDEGANDWEEFDEEENDWEDEDANGWGEFDEEMNKFKETMKELDEVRNQLDEGFNAMKQAIEEVGYDEFKRSIEDAAEYDGELNQLLEMIEEVGDDEFKKQLGIKE